MIDHDQLLAYASQQAHADGIKADTDDFRRAVKSNFDTALRHLTAQVEHETPRFFAPPQPKPASEPATRSAAMVSAPVSREIPSGNRDLSLPTRVSLSVEERQIAAASGISDQEYARNKIIMLRKQRSGEIQT
jgi:hypothetical protein